MGLLGWWHGYSWHSVGFAEFRLQGVLGKAAALLNFSLGLQCDDGTWSKGRLGSMTLDGIFQVTRSSLQLHKSRWSEVTRACSSLLKESALQLNDEDTMTKLLGYFTRFAKHCCRRCRMCSAIPRDGEYASPMGLLRSVCVNCTMYLHACYLLCWCSCRRKPCDVELLGSLASRFPFLRARQHSDLQLLPEHSSWD